MNLETCAAKDAVEYLSDPIDRRREPPSNMELYQALINALNRIDALEQRLSAFELIKKPL